MACKNANCEHYIDGTWPTNCGSGKSISINEFGMCSECTPKQRLLAYRFNNPINDSKYMSKNDKVLLFTKTESLFFGTFDSFLKGTYVLYNDNLPTVTFKEAFSGGLNDV